MEGYLSDEIVAANQMLVPIKAIFGCRMNSFNTMWNIAIMK